MHERTKSFIIYSAKCVTGTLVVLTVSKMFSVLTYADTIWCLFSVLLVLSPEGTDSITLAFTRIKANLLGAAVGFLFITLFPHAANMWTLSLVIVITIGIGFVLKLDASLRPALVAVIIITMPQSSIPSLNTPVERVIAVIAGCFLGVGITYLFHFRQKHPQPVPKEEGNE
ncbi:MAG: FUSC family protein [Saprospiraceae bacterium]